LGAALEREWKLLQPSRAAAMSPAEDDLNHELLFDEKELVVTGAAKSVVSVTQHQVGRP